jgi:hypothetical protein
VWRTALRGAAAPVQRRTVGHAHARSDCEIAGCLPGAVGGCTTQHTTPSYNPHHVCSLQMQGELSLAPAWHIGCENRQHRMCAFGDIQESKLCARVTKAGSDANPSLSTYTCIRWHTSPVLLPQLSPAEAQTLYCSQQYKRQGSVCKHIHLHRLANTKQSPLHLITDIKDKPYASTHQQRAALNNCSAALLCWCLAERCREHQKSNLYGRPNRHHQHIANLTAATYAYVTLPVHIIKTLHMHLKSNRSAWLVANDRPYFSCQPTHPLHFHSLLNPAACLRIQQRAQSANAAAADLIRRIRYHSSTRSTTAMRTVCSASTGSLCTAAQQLATIVYRRGWHYRYLGLYCRHAIRKIQTLACCCSRATYGYAQH